MQVKFHKIKNKTIFTRDFSPLTKNNVIDFEEKNKIAVIYGPNGTGKTSLIKVLSDADETSVEFSIDEQNYKNGKDIFHIINDQNNRNIISGNAKEFLLGDNIKHEFELLEIIKKERQDIIANVISILKNKFSISTMNNPLNKIIENPQIAEFIKDCVNTKSKGAKFDEEKLVTLLSSIKHVDMPEYDENKLLFWQKDYADKKSIIQQIQLLALSSIIPIPSITKIEEDTIAIDILNRFHRDTCIVCDHNIENWEELLQNKQDSYDCTISALDEKLKAIVETIINLVPSNDPFDIKNILLNFLSTGQKSEFVRLTLELNNYKKIYNYLINNELISLFNNSNINKHYEEYKELISQKPEITDEDYLYIEEIINTSMNKQLVIDRDASNKQLKIILEEKDFLDCPRDELPLSNGEQNFLSLAFEFLKAKNSSQPIVVVDDPISSFDSIYKNKVVYAIVRMLQSKKRIILTHNIDFIRLLDSQYSNSFNLYILNNTDGENNGFIRLNNKEQGMLISLQKLLDGFRGNILPYVIDKELFLISMIPFMRGYANIINKKDIFDKLTQVMHGYKTEEIDIAEIYHQLFSTNSEYIPTSYKVSVANILDKNIDGKTIINKYEYPLLDRTLRHSFTYLFLRLIIEKKLVEKFNIEVSPTEQLGQIINKAYPGDNIEQIRNRVRLTSKKTLINEFNHFEGNLSIFQPAIDITDQALGKERTDITTFISNL